MLFTTRATPGASSASDFAVSLSKPVPTGESARNIVKLIRHRPDITPLAHDLDDDDVLFITPRPEVRM
jgi:hypothetical protein